MKLPPSVHEGHPWVMSEIAPDFRLLDAWALPAEGTLEEFDALLESLSAFDPATGDSRLTRILFAVRLQLGEWFGWDEPEERPIPGCTETTLKDRLPEDLRDTATHPTIGGVLKQGGLVPLFRTQTEWAGEVSNATVHGVIQLGWVEQGNGRYQGRLGIYVKPRGALGEVYMKLIEPFRHFIVYPAAMRQIGRTWESRSLIS
jgi:Protein of unknown function (DUF2867)